LVRANHALELFINTKTFYLGNSLRLNLSCKNRRRERASPTLNHRPRALRDGLNPFSVTPRARQPSYELRGSRLCGVLLPRATRLPYPAVLPRRFVFVYFVVYKGFRGDVSTLYLHYSIYLSSSFCLKYCTSFSAICTPALSCASCVLAPMCGVNTTLSSLVNG